MKTKILNIINAMMLPVLILALALITDFGNKEVLPKLLQSLTIPVLPPTLSSYFLFLEILSFLALGLLFLNTIRWPFLIAAYLGFGWIAVTINNIILPDSSVMPFSLAWSAWIGVALAACWKTKLAFVFLPEKRAVPAILLLLIALGLDGLLSLHFFGDVAEAQAKVIWSSSAIGIGTGLACSLIAALLVRILKTSNVPVEKIVFRQTSNTLSDPAKETAGASASTEGMSAPARKAPARTQKTRPTKKTKKAPAPARKAPARTKKAEVAAKTPPPASPDTQPPRKPCKETGKILSNADLREVESIRKKEAQASSVLKPGGAQENDENDWLSKHLKSLEKK